MSAIIERIMAWDNIAQFPTVTQDELRELKAEIARLRTALEEIANSSPYHPWGLREIARKAWDG